MFQFRRQELDGVGETGGREDFLVDALQHVLRGHAVGKAVAQDPEEIGLLNVFFPFENGTGSHVVILPASGLRRQGFHDARRRSTSSSAGGKTLKMLRRTPSWAPSAAAGVDRSTRNVKPPSRSASP